ncbi:MurR/RpiR family transcriptional regulator [Pseudogracilibacillus auburnensis]|uniref:MurR/RpiR family transcriptional regulator n=1 Tax=Pseudogracilibacillus auburnensis TaxID=1494959 RepID=UPI001A95B67D|nr:MurR/RpiR family transcriptional regulator [Pseudogracilibacillus auburnensis]MBO1005896.1 MurR/RpiR family transcriptional regulator [Pseudogracilibacillus auburnensis]
MSYATGGLVMLAEMLEKLPPSEKKIASYILENPRESISLTASELGKRSSTSGAAVIRLCKSLDLKGLQDLKLRIAGDLQKKPQEEFRDIEPNESIFSIIEKMTVNSVQTLRETAELLSMEDVSVVVDMLRNARSVHFFGVGASHIIAQDAQQKFVRIGKHATAFSDVHMAATVVANMGEGDVVIGISFSGETVEVAKILKLANEVGAATISLTKYGSSVVSDQADIRLYTSATREPAFRSGATSSRIAQLHAIDILFMCVASQQYDQSIKYIDQTRRAIHSLKK